MRRDSKEHRNRQQTDDAFSHILIALSHDIQWCHYKKNDKPNQTREKTYYLLHYSSPLYCIGGSSRKTAKNINGTPMQKVRTKAGAMFSWQGGIPNAVATKQPPPAHNESKADNPKIRVSVFLIIACSSFLQF